MRAKGCGWIILAAALAVAGYAAWWLAWFAEWDPMRFTIRIG